MRREVLLHCHGKRHKPHIPGCCGTVRLHEIPAGWILGDLLTLCPVCKKEHSYNNPWKGYTPEERKAIRNKRRREKARNKQ